MTEEGMTGKPPRTFVCIYHRAETDKISKEDILQKAFGGKKTSSTLICSDCNNFLGGTIDHELAESLDWVTNLVNPPSRRRPAATINNVKDANGDVWHIAPGGKPTVPFTSLGETTWKADIADLEVARANAENKAKKMGIVNPEITVNHGHMKAAPIEFALNLKNEIAFRSACKTAFEYLALIGFTQEDRCSELLLEVRDFIMKGTPYSHVGWLIESVIPNAFDGLDHYVVLVQSEDKSVYWEFILYGGIVAVSGRFGPLPNSVESAIYSICTTTGEASEVRNTLSATPTNFLNWEHETTERHKAFLSRSLQKLNIAANIDAELAMKVVDSQDLATDQAYIAAATEEMIQQAIALASQFGNTDAQAVRKLITDKLAQDGFGSLTDDGET